MRRLNGTKGAPVALSASVLQLSAATSIWFLELIRDRLRTRLWWQLRCPVQEDLCDD